MSPRGVGLCVIAALVFAAGCGDARQDEEVGRDASADVDRAVAVARAIQQHPNAADSVLAAHDMTAADFDSLLYRIAADSAMTAEFVVRID